jgi:hypothetical protein
MANSVTPFGANTIFLQTGKRYTPFSALQQFFPTLPVICAQVVTKRFMRKYKKVSLKKKKKIPAPQY